MFAAHICGVKVVKYSSSEMSSVRSQSSDIYQSLIVVPKLLAHRFVLIDSIFRKTCYSLKFTNFKMKVTHMWGCAAFFKFIHCKLNDADDADYLNLHCGQFVLKYWLVASQILLCDEEMFYS